MIEDYKKYRWFFTSSKKLVIGGKSAEQNDELLTRMKKQKDDFLVFHTAEPGSPFSIIVSNPKNVSKSDVEEAAIFTVSFSRAWKLQKKKADVHLFKLSQLYKDKRMKPGTWGVLGAIKSLSAQLKLVLTTQQDVLRAVPEKTPKNKKPLLKISPGKIDKTSMLPKLQELLPKCTKEEILAALPPGGVSLHE